MLLKKFLISVHEMYYIIKSVKTSIILDLRDSEEYEKAHIPNAISGAKLFNNFSEELQSDEQVSEFIHFYKDIFSSLGVDDLHNVVLYESSNVERSIMVVKLLKFLGFDESKIFIVDGGVEEYLKEGFKLDDKKVEVTPSTFMVSVKERSLEACNKIIQHDNSHSKFIDFPRFNKEPVFSFNRRGKLVYNNISKEKNLPEIKKFSDVVKDATLEDIENIIANNLDKKVVIFNKNSKKYYNINLKGSSKTDRILCYGFDITLLKKLNRELQKKMDITLAEQEHERKLAEAKNLFLANISHELRTPLNAILGFTSRLARKEEDAKKLEYLDIIKENSNNLNQLINDILELSRASLELHPKEEVVIDEFFKKILDELKAIAEEKHINLSLTSSYDSQDRVYNIDAINIKKIVSRLLDNAIKFNQDGGKVLLKVEVIKKELIVSVLDSGKGIAKEKIEHIFKEFTQENESFTRSEGGLGVGLAICSKIIKAMDAKLSVSSKEGKGTKFQIIFKL